VFCGHGFFLSWADFKRRFKPLAHRAWQLLCGRLPGSGGGHAGARPHSADNEQVVAGGHRASRPPN
jgi:hypothetical protein